MSRALMPNLLTPQDLEPNWKWEAKLPSPGHMSVDFERRIDHDRDRSVIFSRRTNHGRTTDINVLNGIFKGAIRFGDGLCERIKIDHNQIDGANLIRLGLLKMAGVITAIQNATMNLRMQRLHATTKDLRAAGIGGDIDHGYISTTQCAGRSTGAQKFNAGLDQTLGKRNQSGLIRNTQ